MRLWYCRGTCITGDKIIPGRGSFIEAVEQLVSEVASSKLADILL